jgi:hypothetical protein
MLKAAPEVEAEFTVAADVPEEVRVNDCVVEEFIVTLPKLSVVALSVNFGLAAVAPVPLNDTTAVLPVVELLLIVRLPVADPVAVGLNWTCKVIDCPGFNVAGRVPVTMAKLEPVVEAEFTVTGEVPDDVNVNDCVVAVFSATLPKLSVVGPTVNWGFVVPDWAAVYTISTQ